MACTVTDGWAMGLAKVVCAMASILLGIAQGAGEIGRSLPGQPEAEEILERALDRTTARFEGGAELLYKSVLLNVSEILDSDGEVLKTKTERSLRYALGGEMYEELVQRDGAPLDPEEVRAEARKKVAFVRAARKRAEQGITRDPRERRAVFDRSLMSRYQVAMIGTETMRGNACWVLAFEPRAGRLPSEKAMDKAFNRSDGTLWIRKDDHQLVRIEFALRKPLRYAWGLVATMRKATGEIDFTKVAADLWLPERFQIELELRILAGLRTVRVRVRNRWVDYERISAPAESASAAIPNVRP